MKYYGNENAKSVSYLTTVSKRQFDDVKTPIGYLKSVNKLGEYLSTLNQEVDDMGIDTSGNKYKSIEYNGKTYWYGSNRCWTEVDFYLETPSFYNDRHFNWKRNKKYGTMECVYEDPNGLIEYNCIIKENSFVDIDVRYTACNNRHKNKVTIDHIEVYNGNNWDVFRAIMEWKKGFKQQISENF